MLNLMVWFKCTRAESVMKIPLNYYNLGFELHVMGINNSRNLLIQRRTRLSRSHASAVVTQLELPLVEQEAFISLQVQTQT